ncbi:MAG: hypothetical protein U0T11_03210 [Chitinophagaceae bacterium]
MELIIPERTHQEFGHSISKLLQLLSALQINKNKKVTLNFSQARMLNPFFLGGLACVINYEERQGRFFDFNYGLNYSLQSYLSLIRFPSCHAPEIEKADDFIYSLEKFTQKTYTPIICFPTGDSNTISEIREKVLGAVGSIIRQQLGFTETKLMPISYMIDELTHNVNDHSEAAGGYIFIQYYPSSNYLDLCICDNGVGILSSYNKTNKFNPVNETEAVAFAINGRSTKNRPESKGFGICTSRNMLVNGLNGCFYLMTGNSAYMQTIDYKGIINLPDNFYFQGTFVALRIPTLIPADFNIYSYVE